MKLWTAWSEYYGTGEGRTVMALITYANNLEDIVLKFHRQFGTFYSIGCEAEEGVVRNTYTRHLFSESLLHAVETAKDRANIELYASSHFNFS